MSENAITRRSFLAGTAGAAALVGVSGYMGFDAWEQAHAADTETGGTTEQVNTLCNACSNKCGFKAYVVDGRLDKLIADSSHPYAKGKLCARGYGYSQIAYTEDRLTDPLKRNENGEYDAITWEQAFQEIGDKVKNIIAADGAEALSIVQDPRPSGKYYSKRFINALGSPNLYTHGAACNLSKESGFTLAIGASNYSSDVSSSKMTMFIGRSYADGVRPSHVMAMQKAHEKGAHLVLVDPRCNNSVTFADEWVPVKPGTDLALVLAMSNIVVTEGLYDAQFIADNATGFEEYAESIEGYTVSWAADITGIPESTITRLAHEMADAAPACSIEPGWRGAFGCQYKNSGETARAIALFNALMGCYNQKGGALLTSSVSAGDLDKTKFPPVPKPEGKIAGAEEYPLGLTSMGSNVYATQLAHEGKMKGMFFYNSNLAGGYVNTTYAGEAVENLELSVCIDVQMSETAAHCMYVLPDTSYLERGELPEFIGGKVPAVALRNRVLDVIHPNTKPVDEIFCGLAEACGVGEYFKFTMDELAEAQLASVGVDYDDLKQVGVTSFPDKTFEYGSAPTWKTDSGKIEFTSKKCADAGLTAAPAWIEPAVMPMGDEFRLIDGKQAIHSHTLTTDVPALMQISKDYHLQAAWLNATTAETMGIADGDTIEITNSTHTAQVRVKVTQRIEPHTLFIPGHYGASSKYLTTAYGFGVRPIDFVPFQIEPGYGSAMTHETCVTVKKVGA